MASINLQSEDGYRSPVRSVRVSTPWMKVVSDESGELSPPVVSVASVSSVSSPAETRSSSSTSSIHEQIANASTDRCPPVVSVTSFSYPAETTSSSSFIQEQTVSVSTDRCPPVVSVSSPAETTSSSPIEEQLLNDLGSGCQGEGSDSAGGGGGGNVVKKPVWSKPSNAVELVSAVMDAASWPALGESTKARSSSSSESLEALSDGSLLPALQVPVNSPSSSHKPAAVSPASTPNHVSQVSNIESARDASVEPAMDSYKKDHTHKGPPQGGFGSQPNIGNDQRYKQNAYKRGYGGPHPRGDGSYHQNRNFNNRDASMQPWRGGYRRGGYIRPSAHNSTPFIHPTMPLPMRPFGNNFLYPDAASGMMYFPGPPPPLFPGPFYFPVSEPLHDKIMKQIDFYFSNDNLVKDTYLRRHMDELGWVPVKLIAGFNKVSCLTNNVQLIIDVMQKSTVVEVQGEKMRRRDDWMRWLMPPHVQDSLGSQLNGIGLDEGLQLQPGEQAPVA